MEGDADIAAVARALGDPGRARMLAALGDGRALPAGVLSGEAGVSSSTASGHLGKLVQARLLVVERHGRNRYYRLAGPEVGELLEALARIAPPAAIRSLREGTHAHAVRFARTCYDHLAGRLGTALMAALVARGALAGGDGAFRDGVDRLSSPGNGVDYRLTDAGAALMESLGIDVEAVSRRPRPLVRYCVDWSEQRHHLAGGLGAALAMRLVELGWVERTPASRAVRVTPAGAAGFRDRLGLRVDELPPARERENVVA